MIEDTVKRIKSKIKNGKSIGPENKEQLLSLLNDLEREIISLSKQKPEQAESITHFAKVSAHESTRIDINPALKKVSLEGLNLSIKEFEISHPQLTSTVNHICQILANMGI